MLKRILSIGAVAAFAAMLAACAGADLSPRERAYDYMAKYRVVQIVVETAVTSPLLAGQEDVKDALKASSSAATESVLQYDTLTRGCLRDPETREIILIEGKQCEPRQALVMAGSVSAGLNKLLLELQASGFGRSIALVPTPELVPLE